MLLALIGAWIWGLVVMVSLGGGSRSCMSRLYWARGFWVGIDLAVCFWCSSAAFGWLVPNSSLLGLALTVLIYVVQSIDQRPLCWSVSGPAMITFNPKFWTEVFSRPGIRYKSYLSFTPFHIPSIAIFLI